MRLYEILLGVFSAILFTSFGSCNATYAETNVKKQADMYPKIEGSVIVEKITIEGHEYLLFWGKLAAPSVVHNENCPCSKILRSTN